ncbi:MAG: Rid family detoxifying hydrolase [Kangiellaceae bacterium]|nr:Rid family detoxifying hydrolase [Kangiellaceae bacterium]
MRKLLLVISCLILASSVTAQTLIFHNDTANKNSGLPFSKAAQVGHLLFLSGELGVNPITKTLVAGGIEAETKQLMSNIAATLKQYGSSLDKVAKCTVFLADISEWSTFNKVYVTFFDKNFPARSALAASGLALSARVEVECIAVVD